jgi:hypothetical protein
VSEPTVTLHIQLTADELDVICADLLYCADLSYDTPKLLTDSKALARRVARGDMRVELASRIRHAAIGGEP